MSTDRALPVPPLRLRRIHLHGVGPDGARFDPLDLDFATDGGAASRVLLSLTNTGGKSTLITLISSLIVPAARAQVGGKNLGDYVLSGDTSHVVCEWEDTTDGTRTVTGTVMEWRDGRRQPAHAQRTTTALHRAWYLFRTGTALPGVDDLPFVVDGRRATFEHFTATVTDLIAAHPVAQGLVTRTQGDWTKAIDARTNIDPVLFGYQMRMNDSESGAEKLLASFDTDDNVVRFFLSALNDERELTDFTAKLGEYAQIARDRPRLVALTDFGDDAGPAVATVAARARATRSAAFKSARARSDVEDHVAALVARRDDDRASLAELEDAMRAAVTARETAATNYGQVSDIRLQINLEHARWKLDAAEVDLAARAGDATEAETDARAWALVDDVLGLTAARSRLDAARSAYEAAHAGLAPMRAQVDDAASAFAARLDALVVAGSLEVDELTGQIDEIDDRETQSQSRADELRDQVRDLDDELSAIADTIDAATTLLDAARRDGCAQPGERPTDTLRRWSQARDAAISAAGTHTAAAAAAEGRFDALTATLKTMAKHLEGIRLAEERARQQVEDYVADFAGLGSDDVVAVGGAAPNGPDDAARVADLAVSAARAADKRAAEHDVTARAAEDELAHLDGTGTAPAGADVLAVLDVISDARIGAATGLEWVEHNITDADARAAFISHRPDVAGGVIVNDPARFDDAVAAVVAAAPRTRVPVTVTSAPAPHQDTPGPGPARHVVVPHRATWDRAWAAQLRSELDTTSRRAQEAASAARAAAEQARAVVATCRDVARRWAGHTHATLEAAATEHLAALTDATAERDRTAEEQETQRQAAKDERAAATTATQTAEIAAGHVTTADTLVTATRASEAAQGRRDHVTAARRRAATEAGVVARQRSTDSTNRHRLVERRAQVKATMGTLSQERATITARPGTDPGGNVGALRDTWTSLRSELRAAEAGIAEAATVDRLETEVAAAAERLTGIDDTLIALAEDHASSLAAASPSSRREHQDLARRRAEEAVRARVAAEAAVAGARVDVDRARPPSSSHQNHFDLANAPEWVPASFGDVTGILERLEAHGLALNEVLRAATEDERDARELFEAVDLDVRSFTDTIELWGEIAPSETPFAGTRDAARDELRRRRDALGDAESTLADAEEAQRSAINAVRAIANDRRWLTLEDAVVLRLRQLSDEHLLAEADVLAHGIETLCGSARGDLGNLDKNRSILRDGLVTLCRSQRRLLREVSQASRLPPGLGDLSGQPAVKITFDDAPEDEAAGRLAARIDTWALELAENPKRAASTDQRSRWLADAVRDTVVDRPRAGSWSITILKPRIDGHVSFTPPNRIKDEFSGGQVLTLAVLVYCALSGVRSSHRVGGARPAGCLILDNPFGAASNEALIAMQHRLAAHTGLQLVCATGLHDAGVDAAFSGPGSVIIKLRNDGDVRRNLSYLRLRSAVVDGIDIAAALTGGRDQASEQNWVDGIRYEVGR